MQDKTIIKILQRQTSSREILWCKQGYPAIVTGFSLLQIFSVIVFWQPVIWKYVCEQKISSWLLRISFVKQILCMYWISDSYFSTYFLVKKANSGCRCKCYLHWFIYFLSSPLGCLHLCQFLAVGSCVLPQAESILI